MKINLWNHFRKIAVWLVRSRALLQIAGSSCRKQNRKERKGGGLSGTILRSLNYSNVRSYQENLIYSVTREENMSSGRSEKRGTEQSEAVETQERNISENIPFDPSWVTWSFLFVFLSLFWGEGGEFNKYILLSLVCWFETRTTPAPELQTEAVPRARSKIFYASDNSTANDPEPQMIPDEDRKWSCRKTRNGMEFASMFLCIHFIKKIYR